MSNHVIKIDINDFMERYIQGEFEIRSENDVVQLLVEGYSTSDIAERTIAAQHLEHNTIFRNPKIDLKSGRIGEVSVIARKQRESVELENGETVEINTLRGRPGAKVSTSEEFEQVSDSPEILGYAQTISEDGMKAIFIYLHRILPGYIKERLKEIAANKGDVKGEGEKLKYVIDEIIERYS